MDVNILIAIEIFIVKNLIEIDFGLLEDYVIVEKDIQRIQQQKFVKRIFGLRVTTILIAIVEAMEI
jgi:hypothetical protein